eukprot:2117884-Pleurochrysis_carterae.AAC.1
MHGRQSMPSARSVVPRPASAVRRYFKWSNLELAPGGRRRMLLEFHFIDSPVCGPPRATRVDCKERNV